jgi:hypothetical protein
MHFILRINQSNKNEDELTKLEGRKKRTNNSGKNINQ